MKHALFGRSPSVRGRGDVYFWVYLKPTRGSHEPRCFARGPYALQRRPRAAGWTGGFLNNRTALKLLQQFEGLGEILYCHCATERPGDRQVALSETFPDVDDGPETLRCWARSLAQLAYSKGANPDPFADIAAHPYRFTDPEVARAIEKVRARIISVEPIEVLPFDQVDRDGIRFRQYTDEDGGLVTESEPIRVSVPLADFHASLAKPADPVVTVGPAGATIKYNGETWNVDPDAAEAVQLLLDA